MVRPLALFCLIAIGAVGCCSEPPSKRVVPTATVARVEPQPTTLDEFRAAEAQGNLIAATGRGVAFGLGDQPVEMQAGEALHVLRIDPRSGEILVRRLDTLSLARLSPVGVEVRATTYGR